MVTTRFTPSTLAEEVRSNLPTTPRTTTAGFPTHPAPRRSLTRAGMHPSVTTRSTPSTPAEEVRSILPTTPRTTTTLPGGAVSREAPPCARSGEGVAPQRSIVKEQRARSLRTLLAAGSLFLILLRCSVLFTKVRHLRISSLSGYLLGAEFIHILGSLFTTTIVEPPRSGNSL